MLVLVFWGFVHFDKLAQISQVFCIFLFLAGVCVFGTIISQTNTILMEMNREATVSMVCLYMHLCIYNVICASGNIGAGKLYGGISVLIVQQKVRAWQQIHLRL